MSDGPQPVSREAVLEIFEGLGVTRVFWPVEPWHGNNLRDAYYHTSPVGRIIEMEHAVHVSRLPAALRIRREGTWLPLYREGSGDCENHAAWFLAHLQQSFAARMLLEGEPFVPAGYGAFTVDYRSEDHGNHQALAFLHHDLAIHFFETLDRRWFQPSPAELESVWHIGGS